MQIGRGWQQCVPLSILSVLLEWYRRLATTASADTCVDTKKDDEILRTKMIDDSNLSVCTSNDP